MDPTQPSPSKRKKPGSSPASAGKRKPSPGRMTGRRPVVTKGGSSSSMRKAAATKKIERMRTRGRIKALSSTDTATGQPGAERKSRPVIPAVRQEFHMGAPLWLKFAGFTCFLLSFFLVILGILAFQLTKREVDAQINNTGKKLVYFVGIHIGPFWLDLDGEALKEQKQKIEKQLRAYKKEDPDILEILLVESKGGRYFYRASTRDEGEIELSADLIYKDGDFSIEEGQFNHIRTRLFTLNLRDEDDMLVGKAQVYLRADRIDKIQSAFAKSIIAVCVAGILLGMLFTFGVVKYLTMPLTALMEDIRIVSSGNLEHETIPKSYDEIGVLAVTFNQMTQKLRIAQEEELKKKALEHELEIATEIQTKLLPERLPQIPGYDIFIYYLSAKHVGGDYYDFIFIDKEHLGIVVADVSGKGIPGSMVMTMTRSLLRLAARGNPSPADTLKKVNRILAQDIRRGMFVTVSYSVLNVRTRRLTIASAGHNPLILYRAQTRDLELVKPNGIALGFDKGPLFDTNIVEEVVQLHRGDRIVAYTDGVVEAMNEADEEFTDERFYELTRQYGHKSSKEYVQIIVRALEQHRGNAPQSDDITLSTIRVE